MLKLGVDYSSVHSNHLKYLNDEKLSAVQLLFNLCLKHGHVAEQMLKCITKPMLKIVLEIFIVLISIASYAINYNLQVVWILPSTKCTGAYRTLSVSVCLQEK